MRTPSISPHGLQHPDRRFYSSTANTNVTHEPISVSSPNKGKGKAVAPAEDEDDEDDEDDEEEEEEEGEEEEEEEMEVSFSNFNSNRSTKLNKRVAPSRTWHLQEVGLEEIDPSAIRSRRTRGVRVDYTSAEALAKAGLKPGDDEDEDEEMH